MMFKKRNTKTKTTLDSILTQIKTQEEYQSNQNMSGKGQFKEGRNIRMGNDVNEEEINNEYQNYNMSKKNNVGKANFYEIGGGVHNVKKQISSGNVNYSQRKNQNQLQEIDLVKEGIITNREQMEAPKQKFTQLDQVQQCFKQFMSQQKEGIEDQNYHSFGISPKQIGQHEEIQQGFISNEHYNMMEVQEDYMPQQMMKPKPLSMINEIIIQDQSGEQIEVRQDYGEISPQSDQSNDSQYFKESLENKLIRQALTKHNYDRLKTNLQPERKSSHKNKLISKLKRISFASIQIKMLKDLQMRKSRKKQIETEIKYLQNKVLLRKKQIEGQTQSKNKLNLELEQVTKMIEMLYYFGSQIDIRAQLKIDNLAQLVEEAEWKNKLEGVRAKVSKIRKQYEAKMRKQKDKSEKQGSDVEQIDGSKFKEKWGEQGAGLDEDEGGADEGEEQGGDKKRRGEKMDGMGVESGEQYDDEDDQYIEADD